MHLFRLIEKVHPDPYAKRSKEEVDRDRQALYEELDQPMTIVDFYRRVAHLVASLGDDHTEVIPNGDTMDQINGYEKGLPLGVEFENGQAFITANYSDNRRRPSRCVGNSNRYVRSSLRIRSVAKTRTLWRGWPSEFMSRSRSASNTRRNGNSARRLKTTGSTSPASIYVTSAALPKP